MDTTKLAKGNLGDPEVNPDINAKGDFGQREVAEDRSVSSDMAKYIAKKQYKIRDKIQKDLGYNPERDQGNTAGDRLDDLLTMFSDDDNRRINQDEIYRRLLQGNSYLTKTGGAWGDGLPPLRNPGDIQGRFMPAMSIETPTSDADKINLEFADARADMPKSRITQRAVKAGIALGEDPKALEVEISDAQGEGQVRQRAQYKSQQEFQQAKSDYLDEVLKNRDPSKPMDLSEAMFIQDLAQDQFTPDDPIAMEKLYSEKIANRLLGTTHAAQAALAKDPDGYNDIQDAVEQNTQRKEIAQKLWEDKTRDYSANTGIIGHIWNVGEQFIPVKSDWNKYDFALGGLPGDNMANRIRNLYMLPPERFKSELEKAYDQIAYYNPLDANEFLASVLSYSRMDSSIANAMFGLDVATTLPVGWIFKGGKVVKDTEKAISQLDRSVLTGERATIIKGRAPDYKSDGERLLEGWDVGEVDFPDRGAEWTKSVSDYFKQPQRAADYKTDEERLLDGWDVGEVDFPPEFLAAQAAKDTQKALAKEEINLEDLFAETGHQDQAIDIAVAQQTAEMLSKAIPDVKDIKAFAALSSRLNSMYNPRAWLMAGSRLSREAAERIMTVVDRSRIALENASKHGAQATRLTPEALAQAEKLGRLKMRDEFRFANNGVIDTRWEVIPQSANPETQTNDLVMTIGTMDALGFKRPEDAIQAAEHMYKIRPGDYKIAPSGGEYYIQVRRTLDETDPSVQAAMITTGNETPRSIWNTFLGYMRNPDDLLSPFSRENRKAVTGIGQALQEYFASAAKDIGSLSGKQKTRMNRLMEVNRDNPGPDGKRGMWFTSVADYENQYFDLFKQWPTENETRAYMLTREISDFDWSVRSMTILRDKNRLGITQVHVKVPERIAASADGDEDDLARLADDGGPAGEVNFSKTQLTDKSFEGKLLDKLPEYDGHYDASVYIVKEGESTGELKYLSDLDRKEIERLINDEGYKVYQNADPKANPFEGMDPKVTDRNFFLLKNAQTSALRAEDQLPYRAGYHVEYAPGFYTKQGKFYRDGKGRRTYGGDVSLLYHVSEAGAQKYTRSLEKARLLLKSGDTEALKTLLRNELPHTYEQFVRFFSDGTLDIDTPILYTRSGQNTRDSVRAGQGSSDLYEGVRDAYNSPYNLTSSVNRQFAQEKDMALPSVVKGSEGNPAYDFGKAKMIDPLVSLSRSMHNMVKMRVYDNYQHQAISSFVEEFANPATLGGSVTKRDLAQVRNNPLAFITDPMWNEKAPRDKLMAAKNAHRAIVNLLGVQSPVSKNTDWVINKLVNTMFEKYGDGAASKTSDFLAASLKDPSRYARHMAFHAKLGLFNPVQLFLQAQSVVHAAALTGNLKRSYQAMGSGMLMRYLSLTSDEKIIQSFANKSRAFGWKADEFLESYHNMKLAGISHVEGEVADLNDIFSAGLFKSRGRQWLDKGTFFFKEGERMVRLNAWNTAYLEFKKANPGKAIGDIERNQILRRYDDLAINMTRSSTGAWQQGVLSVPAQFSTYQIHLMEQLLGKRLTRAEKSRAVAVYSALYGLPTGIAAGTALWPMGQDIKQAAMERGIDVNNGVMDVLMNGIIASSFEAVTGQEYDVAGRWGPNGLTVFKEALNGEKGLLDVMFGPSGQIATEIITGLDPVARDLTAIFRDGEPKYQLLAEDIAAALRNVSTVNNSYQMIYAMNAGKFMSKNGLFTSEADSMDAVMKGIFGLDPRTISDAYIKIESMKEFKEAQKDAQQKFVKSYNKALENFSDPKAFEMYMKDAHAWLVMGGFRPDQYDDLMRAAAGNDLSLIDKIYRQYNKYGPPGNVDQINEEFNQRNQ